MNVQLSRKKGTLKIEVKMDVQDLDLYVIKNTLNGICYIDDVWHRDAVSF